jgi:hypothetical protein
MGILARDLVLASLCYLLPGNAILLLAEVRGLSGARRQFIALCVSLIVVPYAFQIVANVHRFLPDVIPLAALCAGALAAAYLLRRSRRRPILSARVDESSIGRTRGIQDILVWLFLAAFAVVANLPRLQMFLSGSSTLVVSPADETYHLAQLTSVARTGIPPSHYFFPQIHLAYYYGSWIYPAILGNIPQMAVSLARALAIHSTLQTFAFLGLVWLCIRSSATSWKVRWLGMAFFTFVGGFDYFASLPSIDAIDWWQTGLPFLVSSVQVPQFVTVYAWAPQHLAGGMAFVAMWLLWSNVQAPAHIKAGLSGILAAFCLSTSPFVFMAFVLASGLLAFAARKRILADPRVSLKSLGLFCFLFFVSSWGILVLYSARQVGLGWSDFRVVVLERFRGVTDATVAVDKVLTLLGFPLVGTWLLTVEMGLPFLLYLAWWARRVTRGEGFKSPFDFTMALLPPLWLLAVFLITDPIGGGNIAKRGLLPSQVLVVLGGVAFLDELSQERPRSRLGRVFATYMVASFIVAQTISGLTELRAVSVEAVKAVLSAVESGESPFTGRVPPGSPWAWPSHLNYMRWIDANTPSNSIIIEEGCPAGEDEERYRWLERIRVLSVGCARSLGLFQRDWDFILSTEWQSLKDHPQAETSALALYQASDFPLKDSPAYLVVWQGASVPPGFEDMVYRDPYVAIYRVP